jgi:hypothetical protein
MDSELVCGERLTQRTVLPSLATNSLFWSDSVFDTISFIRDRASCSLSGPGGVHRGILKPAGQIPQAGIAPDSLEDAACGLSEALRSGGGSTEHCCENTTAAEDVNKRLHPAAATVNSRFVSSADTTSPNSARGRKKKTSTAAKTQSKQ